MKPEDTLTHTHTHTHTLQCLLYRASNDSETKKNFNMNCRSNHNLVKLCVGVRFRGRCTSVCLTSRPTATQTSPAWLAVWRGTASPWCWEGEGPGMTTPSSSQTLYVISSRMTQWLAMWHTFTRLQLCVYIVRLRTNKKAGSENWSGCKINYTKWALQPG